MQILTGKSNVKMQIAKVEMGIIRRHNTPPPPNRRNHPQTITQSHLHQTITPPPKKRNKKKTPSPPQNHPPNQQRIRSSEVTLSDIIISVVYMSGHNSSLETEKN